MTVKELKVGHLYLTSWDPVKIDRRTDIVNHKLYACLWNCSTNRPVSPTLKSLAIPYHDVVLLLENREDYMVCLWRNKTIAFRWSTDGLDPRVERRLGYYEEIY